MYSYHNKRTAMKFGQLYEKVKKVKQGIATKNYIKENHYLDYKKLSKIKKDDLVNSFLAQFAKPILAFGNTEGGMIIVGVGDEKGQDYSAEGMEEDQIQAFKILDAEAIKSRMDKKLDEDFSISIELDTFEVNDRTFGCILIERNPTPLTFKRDCKEWNNIKEGAIYHRKSTSTKEAKKHREIKLYYESRVEKISWLSTRNLINSLEELTQLPLLAQNQWTTMDKHTLASQMEVFLFLKMQMVLQFFVHAIMRLLLILVADVKGPTLRIN